MNTITFPGLGIELTVSKIAFTIVSIPIAWYAIFIVCAILIALFLLRRRDGMYNIAFQDIFDLSLYLIPIAFLCARVYYVIFNMDYFMQHPSQILNIKQGGLAIYGGIIGGAITCYFFTRKRNISLWDLLDYIVPVLALRTGNRKMGQFYKYRSIWNPNIKFTKNGNMGKWYL